MENNNQNLLPGNQPKVDEKRRAVVVILVIVMVVSLLFGLLFASKVDMYKTTIERLDESRNTVTQLMASATAASALLTLIPGDVATPIAEKLADVAGDFIIVLCAIYAEKFMLTILGALAFVFLIPAGCLSKLWAMVKNNPGWSTIGTKLIATGIAVALLVPVSAWVSDTIRDNYGPAIDQTIQAAQDMSDEVQDAADAAESESGDTEKSGNWFQNLFNSAEEKISGATEKFQQLLNNMMEAFAVLIVTTCVIPIVVLLVFFWLVKTTLNADMNLKLPMPGRRRLR